MNNFVPQSNKDYLLEGSNSPSKFNFDNTNKNNSQYSIDGFMNFNSNFSNMDVRNNTNVNTYQQQPGNINNNYGCKFNCYLLHLISF